MKPTVLVPAGPSASRLGPRDNAGRRWRVLRQLVEVVGVALLIGAALTIFLAGRSGRPGVIFAVMSLISLCFAGAYVGIMRFVLDRLLERTNAWWQAALLHVAAVGLAGMLGAETAVQAVTMLGGRVDRLRVLGTGVAVLTAIRVIELGYEQLRRRVREVELAKERAQQQALRAEIAALQARTDPHFLFNSLNTVAGLIEEDPERAVAVVTRLAGYFRHTVHAAREGRVSLAEELEAAKAYLEIQGLRFGNALEWAIDVAGGIESVQVPAFVLQPLVENAVVHGASGPAAGTQVVISVRRSVERIVLAVEDDGPGPGGSTHAGSGSTLADLGERLELLYSGAASLVTGAGSLGGFLVQVELPIEGDEQMPGGQG